MSTITCSKNFSLHVAGCDEEDEPLLTKGFVSGANDFFEAVIPADKPGFYQIRYIGGSQSRACQDTPDYVYYGAFFGDVRILVNGVQDTDNWVNSNWIGDGGPASGHAGAKAHSGYTTFNGHIILIDGNVIPGIFSLVCEVCGESNVEFDLTNLALPARYQKFCFERLLSGGETVRFEFGQEFYTLCDDQGGPIHLGNTTQMALLRVNHC